MFHLISMSSALLSIAHYNPMQANTVDRINHIAYHTKNFDVTVLVGTKVPHAKYLKDDFSQRHTDCGSLVLDAGYGKGRYTNKHTGISFILNGKTLRSNNLVDKGALKADAKGRAAFLRFKARGGDFAILGIYYPPKPSKKAEEQRYLRACEIISDWIADVLRGLPAGCTPFIAVDLNDGIGKTRHNGLLSYNETTVILERASRREKLFEGAGAHFRRICELFHLEVHTANRDHRDTWYSGDGRASSLIDYIAAPGSLHVRKAGQLSTLGNTLQHVEVNRKVDHRPIFLSFYVGEDKSHFQPAPRQRWNFDLLMECLNNGKHKVALVQDTEECCKTFMERHPGLLDQHTPDDLAEKLMEELVEIAQKHFHKDDKGQTAAYKQAKRIRLALLAERGKLRQQLQADEALSQATLSQVQHDLQQLTKMLHASRTEQWNVTSAQLSEEIHEAWRRRDMKTSYALMRRLAGSKFDVKKRDWRLVQQALPSRKEWEDLLVQAGNQGGMKAVTTTWEAMRQEHTDVAAQTPLAPQSMNHVQRAREEIKNLATYVIHASKRKAVPQDALPTEILVALLAPNYVRHRQRPALQSKTDANINLESQRILGNHQGLGFPAPSPSNAAPPTPHRDTITFVPGPACPATTGRPDQHQSEYKAPKLTNPHTKQMFLALHTHIERTGQTPLIWHRSQGVAIAKHNGKKGAQGSRLVHVLDPMGKAFYAKKHKQPPPSHNDTGFAAHRRREYATLCQNCTNYKLVRAKRNFVNNNHDCTNAFCCTSLDECDDICDRFLFDAPEDKAFGKQRHRYSSSIVQSREDKRDPQNKLFVRPQQGNLQGDTQAVKTFPLAFVKPTNPWILQHMDIYDSLGNEEQSAHKLTSASEQTTQTAPSQPSFTASATQSGLDATPRVASSVGDFRTTFATAIADYEYCHTECPQTGQVVDTAHTKYADDIVKTVLGPEPNFTVHGHSAGQRAMESLIRRAEASSMLLSEALEEEGYAQNTDKLIGVVSLNGHGAHTNLRHLQQEQLFSYTITDNTKSLGSIINARGSFQHERTARLEAIVKASFILGKRITLKNIPWKLKRTLLIGQVLNVALSGVEAYALQPGDYETLQTAVTKILRKAMGRKAVQIKINSETGQHEIESQVSNAAVLRYWRISTVKTELVIRRIRMYQTMAKYPQDSVLPMAAAFGTMKGESLQLGPPVWDGYITEHGTPWAKQFQADMDFWCTANEDADELFKQCNYRYFLIFTDAQTKEDFLLLDPTFLRSWEQSAMIPDANVMDSMPEAHNLPLATTHTCSICSASFYTYRQLRTHESITHDIRCIASLLTPTNCCANCNTIFSTRASAVQHLQSSLKRGYCKPHRAHNLRTIQPSSHLHCMYCTALDPTNETTYDDLAQLLQHLKSHHLAHLGTHPSHDRCSHAFMGEARSRKQRRRRGPAKKTHDRSGSPDPCSHSSIGQCTHDSGEGPQGNVGMRQNNRLDLLREPERREVARMGGRGARRAKCLVSKIRRRNRHGPPEARFASCPNRGSHHLGGAQSPRHKEGRAQDHAGSSHAVVEPECLGSGQVRERRCRGDPSLPCLGPATEQAGKRRRHGTGGANETFCENDLPTEQPGCDAGLHAGPADSARRHTKRPWSQVQADEGSSETSQAAQVQEEVSSSTAEGMLQALQPAPLEPSPQQGMPTQAAADGLPTDTWDSQDFFPGIGEDPEGTAPQALVETQKEPRHRTAFREFVIKNRIDPGSFTTHSMFRYPPQHGSELTDADGEPSAASVASTDAHVPARRCRGKTSVKQLIAENNLKVAHHIPHAASDKRQAAKQTAAIITQADMVSTSRYVQYHKLMGHTPPNLVAVNNSHKKRFLQATNLPTEELKNKRLFVVVDESVQHKRLKALLKKRKLSDPTPHVQCSTQQ